MVGSILEALCRVPGSSDIRQCATCAGAAEPPGEVDFLTPALPGSHRHTISAVQWLGGLDAGLRYLKTPHAIYPLGPVFHGSVPNVTVLPLHGRLNVGPISRPELLPDLWELADDFDLGMTELLDATR